MKLGTFTVDGRQVAEGGVERTTPIRFSLEEGMDVGEDTDTPVSLDYDAPKPSVPRAVAGSKGSHLLRWSHAASGIRRDAMLSSSREAIKLGLDKNDSVIRRRINHLVVIVEGNPP